MGKILSVFGIGGVLLVVGLVSLGKHYQAVTNPPRGVWKFLPNNYETYSNPTFATLAYIAVVVGILLLVIKFMLRD